MNIVNNIYEICLLMSFNHSFIQLVIIRVSHVINHSIVGFNFKSAVSLFHITYTTSKEANISINVLLPCYCVFAGRWRPALAYLIYTRIFHPDLRSFSTWLLVQAVHLIPHLQLFVCVCQHGRCPPLAAHNIVDVFVDNVFLVLYLHHFLYIAII
uniref:Uncharacterized protein n=1 Tax=Arion vulgaris TaxID=1028688 RepID=A0A0B7AH28_9EUPU